MKTLIKLLIAAAVINAAARAGLAAVDYYRLKDTAEQLITFGLNDSTTDLHNRIVEKAAQLHLPLQPENVAVHRRGTRTTAAVSYVEPVEFFPGWKYPVELAFEVEAYSTFPGRPEDAP